MYLIRLSVVALALAFVTPLHGVARVAPAAAATTTAAFDSGSDLRLVHVTNNVPEQVAFGPDGSAYSIARGSLILRLAPSGARTLISYESSNTASPGAAIVYSNGFLWFVVHQGLERVKVDGTDGRYYAPPSVTGQRSFNQLTAGPNGIYYLYYAGSGRFPNAFPMLAEISNSFNITDISLAPSVPPKNGIVNIGALAAGPSGGVYFEVAPGGRPVTLGRVDATGAVTFFKDADLCGGASQLVFTPGAFYFIAYQNSTTVSLCRVSLTGYYSKILTTTALPNAAPSLTADSTGGIWTTNFFGTGLYSFAVETGAITGPYDPVLLSSIFQLQTGPDQNIYFYGHYASSQLFFGAYLRHQLAFLPTVVSLYSADPSMDFYVSEALPSSPWTARSLNTAVATVVPSSSLPGRFSVTQTGVGTTSIAVTDIYGNTSYLPVTAN